MPTEQQAGRRQKAADIIGVILVGLVPMLIVVAVIIFIFIYAQKMS